MRAVLGRVAMFVALPLLSIAAVCTPEASAATNLPTGFGAIATDPTTGRVFVSSPTSNVVTVLDPAGTVVNTIANEAGANSLLVDSGTLYVAATNAGVVDAFDTTTLTKTASFGGGALVKPNTLAKAGGKLWTTTGTCASYPYPQLVSIDVATGTATTFPAITWLSYCPNLTASPTDPNLLIGFDLGLSPATLVKLDVSSGAPVVVLSQRESNLGNLKQLAFAPDGQSITTASGAPYEIDTFRVSDLLQTGIVYATGNYPNAVATTGAGGGLLAAGRDASYTPDVDVFRFGQPANRLLQKDYGTTTNTLKDRGLAFSADGSRLYAVTGYWSTNSVILDVLTVTVPTSTVLTTSGSPTVVGQPVTLTASVSLNGGGSPTSGTVTFKEGAATLGTAAVIGGSASLTTSALGLGSHSLTAVYNAAGAFGASTSTPVTQVVDKAATSAAVSSSLNPAKRNQSVTFTASVAAVSPGSGTPTGTVTFKDGPTVLATKTLTAGSATFTTSTLSVATHSITVVYAGDASFNGSTSPVLVQTITKK